MRTSTGLLFAGLVAGALATVIVVKMKEREEALEPESLVDRAQEQLEALEARLAEVQAADGS